MKQILGAEKLVVGTSAPTPYFYAYDHRHMFISSSSGTQLKAFTKKI